MPPAFVINLDRSADRLAFIKEQAGAVGLEFARIAAVDGTAVPSWLRSQFLDDDGKPVSSLIASEIGCYASHLVVHRRIVQDDLPWALVLEDDVHLEQGLVATVEAAIAVAPAGWDYIHLSGLVRRTVFSLSALPNGRHLARHTRIPTNTGGYLISRSGAEKMLVPGTRIRPIDQEFRFPWVRDLDVLAVYPSPVIWSDHMPTTIDWRGLPKRDFGVRRSKLRERVYAIRKLGLLGYGQCALADLRRTVERRLLGRSSGAVTVVCSSAAPLH